MIVVGRMRCLEKRETSKMADENKIRIESQQVVHRIHTKLKKEVHRIAQSKSWDDKKKEQFEERLLELYRDTVEESVKQSVTVECTSENMETSEQQKEANSLSKKRMVEVYEMWSQLDNLIRDTTRKRKQYPPQIVDAIRTVQKYRVEAVEAYTPSIRIDPIQPVTSTNNEDCDKCLCRLQAAVQDLSTLSKILQFLSGPLLKYLYQASLILILAFSTQDFPEIQTKMARLKDAMQSHKAMESSRTDEVLFGKEKLDTAPRRSGRIAATPETLETRGKTLRTPRKRTLGGEVVRRSLVPRYKRK